MYDAYEVIKTEELPDIRSAGTLLRHKKTGARVALVSNDDDNKVFGIAFRTPPADSTGVAHIIEHSVLCGSEKFPLKDPFVELAKGSLNTFLNAITFPDKTMYPVASCNDQDLKNLMEVYMDAVFFPAIYKNENIFLQEGWHYHLEKEEDELTINGVVYNEMKGAFSTADAVLERSVFSALFPDTAYGVESGGDPDSIPDLTYEKFLEFHRTYYHPSNSYIYLYGNMDMDERLDWIDREYLSRFDALEVDSALKLQKPFDEPKELSADYPVLEGEPLEDNTYLNMSTVVADGCDVLTNAAFSVLEYVLLDSPGAPVKQALLDAGIGRDVDGSFQDGLLQTFFSIDAKYANPGDAGAFKKVIFDTLQKCADEGLDEKALKAAINYYEFRFREADYSVYPKGLIYGMNMFDTWLYDDNRPFEYLKMLGVFDELKKRIGTGYYEDLIREKLINNPHRLVMTLNPKAGMAREQEEKLAGKLAEHRASLSEEEIRGIVRRTKELADFQESEDDPSCLPALKRSDLDKKTPIVLKTKESESGGTKILQHDYATNGIAYLTLLFNADKVPDRWLPYLSLLKSVLGYVSTENYTYRDLSNEINARTGGLNCGVQNLLTKDGEEKRFFGIRSKYLYPEQDFVFGMIREILLTSDLTDEKRLYTIISKQKASYQVSLSQAGHLTAVTRAAAGASSANAFQELVAGIEYYRFLEQLFNDFDSRKEELVSVFRTLIDMIFTGHNFIADITAEDEGMAGLAENIESLKAALGDRKTEVEKDVWTHEFRKEAFRTSGQVQYVATVGNFKKKGYEYTGVLQVLRTMMNFDYLWMNIRVKGGAYGCMSGFRRSGDSYLVSYRDPHLKNTLDVFAGLPDYLRNFKADDDEMTRYVIGTISTLDTPKNASAMGSLAMDTYFRGIDISDIQKERDEILNADDSKIRGLADMLEAALDLDRICVVGSESAVEKHKDLFEDIQALT